MASHKLADLLARKLGADAAATGLRIERGLRRYLQRRGSQLDFFHGELRQAVFEQYGPQAEAATVHSDVANYFRDLADPERKQSWKGGSPRPFLEVAFHLAGAQRLDELCQTLCDLRFVEARCRVSQVFELQGDYRRALETLPEVQTEWQEQQRHEARAARWTAEIIEYARQWSARRGRIARGETVAEPRPALPEIIPSVEPWSYERIEAECQCIIKNPTRLDRLQAFAGFVELECHPLV